MLWWTLRQLKSKHWETRKQAAEKLGEARNVSTLASLVEALNERNPDVRQAVEAALVKISPNWSQLDATQNVIPTLIDRLKSDKYDVQAGAKEALVLIGSLATDRLSKATNDGNVLVRRVAKEALSRIMHNEEMSEDPGEAEVSSSNRVIDHYDTETILSKLSSNEEIEQIAAIEAAGNRKVIGAVDALIQLLDIIPDKFNELIEKKTEKSTEAMMQVFVTLPKEVKDAPHAAAAALGQIRDPRAIDPLLGLLRISLNLFSRAHLCRAIFLGPNRSANPEENIKFFTTLDHRPYGSVAIEALAQFPDVTIIRRLREDIFSLDPKDGWDTKDPKDGWNINFFSSYLWTIYLENLPMGIPEIENEIESMASFFAYTSKVLKCGPKLPLKDTYLEAKTRIQKPIKTTSTTSPIKNIDSDELWSQAIEAANSGHSNKAVNLFASAIRANPWKYGGVGRGSWKPAKPNQQSLWLMGMVAAGFGDLATAIINPPQPSEPTIVALMAADRKLEEILEENCRRLGITR